MQIIKKGSIVEDSWQLLGMEEPLVDGNNIVPFSRWQAEREQLLAHKGQLGLLMSGGDDLDAVVRDMAHFTVIALSFERFADGRSYSYARLLRERYNYSGELRAVGDVQRDQLNYMKRCGFDSFVMAEGQNIEASLKAFDEFSNYYQTAADQAQPIYRQRLS